jgi:translation initiation factor 1 (eIF-1/SUI1)
MNPFDEFEENEINRTTSIEIWLEINGRKKNTYVAGWNIPETELKEHIKTIKKKNACNGTLKEISSNGDKSELIKVIQLQGDHIDYMRDYLISQDIDEGAIRIRG